MRVFYRKLILLAIFLVVSWQMTACGDSDDTGSDTNNSSTNNGSGNNNSGNNNSGNNNSDNNNSGNNNSGNNNSGNNNSGNNNSGNNNSGNNNSGNNNSGNNNSGNNSTGNIPLDELQELLAQTQCERAFNCCTDDELEFIFEDPAVDSVETCLEGVGGPNSEFTRLVGAVEEGRVIYDGSAAFACIEMINTASCDLGLDVEDAAVACDEVFLPNAELGEECYNADECTSQRCDGVEYNDDAEIIQAGTCVALSEIDEECARASDDCVEDTFCVQKDGATYTCQPAAQAGEPCYGNEGEDCSAGTYCVRLDPDDSATSICQPVLSMGDECWDEGCPEDAYCAGVDFAEDTPGTCQPHKQDGESCERFDECGKHSICSYDEDEPRVCTQDSMPSMCTGR